MSPTDPTSSPVSGPNQRPGTFAEGTSRGYFAALAAVIAVIVACVATLVWYGLSARDSRDAAPTAQSDSVAVGSPKSPPQSSRSPQEATPVEEPRPAPTLDEMKNATLTLPPVCAGFALQDEASPATFVDGTAHSANDQHATVTLTDVRSAVFGGANVALTVMNCFGGGAYGYDTLAVYDPDLQLIGALEEWDSSSHLLKGMVWELEILDLAIDGDRISFTVPNVQILGDQGCHACGGSASAHVVEEWNGSGFSEVSVVYSTPSGDVVAPDQELVQQFYDAAATGDDAFVARYTDEWNVRTLQEGCLGACPTPDSMQTQALRLIQFPEGGTVGTCVLIGAVDGEYGGTNYMYGDPSGRSIDSFSIFSGRPGDFVCGVDTSTAPENTVMTAADKYNVYLVIRPTTDPENFRVLDFGRNFS